MKPARTLAGLAKQLERGERLTFSPELHELARQVLAKPPLTPEEVDALIPRLAQEMSEFTD